MPGGRYEEVPIIANGNVRTWDDVQQNLALTAANGIMSAEGLLDNPALFNGGQAVDALQLADEYLDLAEKHPVKMKSMVFHIRRMCRELLTTYQVFLCCLLLYHSLPKQFLNPDKKNCCDHYYL